MARKRSIYSITFNNQSRCWEKSRKYNVMFLLHQQHYANDLLRNRYYRTHERSYLFLHEVLEMLDMPLTSASYCVAWVYDEKNPIGDNFVDFGVNVRGTNPNVILDFNVDGYIVDKVFL